jgi:hypothetical protein
MIIPNLQPEQGFIALNSSPGQCVRDHGNFWDAHLASACPDLHTRPGCLQPCRPETGDVTVYGIVRQAAGVKELVVDCFFRLRQRIWERPLRKNETNIKGIACTENSIGKAHRIASQSLTALENPPHCLRRTVSLERVDRRAWNWVLALASAKRVLWGLLVSMLHLHQHASADVILLCLRIKPIRMGRT